MSSRKVTVAMLGDPEKAFTVDAVDWERQLGDGAVDPPVFEHLQQVVLRVQDDEPLGEVLARAVEQFELAVPPDVEIPLSIGFFAFDDPGRPLEVRHELTLVDECGRAVWGVWEWRETPYGEVVKALVAGAMRGSPDRLYLILLPAAGGGFPLTWSQIVTVYEIARQVIEDVANVGEVVALAGVALKLAKDRLSRGRKAVATKYIDWDERGGHGGSGLRLDVGAAAW